MKSIHWLIVTALLACIKVQLYGPDSLYCGKWRKISKSRHDLDLGLTMLTTELVRAISIYYNVFQFHFPRSITF